MVEKIISLLFSIEQREMLDKMNLLTIDGIPQVSGVNESEVEINRNDEMRESHIDQRLVLSSNK